MTQPVSEELVRLVAAARPHVAFDGWSDASFDAAVRDLGLDPARARAIAPRRAVDLAVAQHRIGDAAMAEALARRDLAALRYRERVALALTLRLEAITDREAVRRAASLFSLPHLVPTGAALVWGTADAVWAALGDSSRDGNWYSKRATLSAVWASVFVYWLGDESENAVATRAFIDRRIEDVMRFEKTKARLAATPALGPLTRPLSRLMGALRAPGSRDDLPGQWRDSNG